MSIRSSCSEKRELVSIRHSGPDGADAETLVDGDPWRACASAVSKQSAGLVMYRMRDDQLEVLLGHPGGPLWAKKDAGAWSVIKGEIAPGEPLLSAAQREFSEETGWTAQGPFIELGSVRQKSGKVVHAWAFRGDCDPATLQSNQVEIEWPPRSGKRLRVPELDRAEFFPLPRARLKINPAQVALLDALERALSD